MTVKYVTLMAIVVQAVIKTALFARAMDAWGVSLGHYSQKAVAMNIVLPNSIKVSIHAKDAMANVPTASRRQNAARARAA
jgi:hypothetical protein